MFARFAELVSTGYYWFRPSPREGSSFGFEDKNANAQNITSESGGLVLPRVKLTNRKTLDLFIISSSDTEWNNVDVNIVKKLKDDHIGLILNILS